jgi:NAD(P)-dependent dehydrogenase (short-subunit alcohol dehydrogenase family)
MAAGARGGSVDGMQNALVTGASRGLGHVLARDLVAAGWRVVGNARTAGTLPPGIVGVPGDLTDPAHRAELATTAGERLDLLVLNAGALGPSPPPRLADYPLDALRAVLEVNLVSQLGLIQATLPALRAAGGTVLAVSSDAAVQPYPGWGGYGAGKAGLDLLVRVLGAEEPALRVYAVDPGDMRTRMQQDAYPGEDISDRPDPATVLPALRRLLGTDLPPGRYTAAGLARAGAR